MDGSMLTTYVSDTCSAWGHGSHPPHGGQSLMGSGVSKHAENTVSESTPADTEPPSPGGEFPCASMRQVHPTITITPPSREDLLAPAPSKTIEVASREARPGVPIWVGRRPFPAANA
ncbi:hypothetical protein AAFF_G00287220 [Aldrovandia affinis]|uniref:Uncharacterized protein n=1 Tax=Aldrovandia affinis TaxID=143900 RepID=A0AAD7X245_9TELE|nr:hypothetical protein AAFF_G00287220 [Aldrovandia affinis]